MKAVAIGLALVGAASADAQKGAAARNVELAGTPKCARCGARLEEVAVLGDMMLGPGRLEIDAYAFDKKRGLAYVRGVSRSEVNAFDLAGQRQFTIGVRDRRPPAGARDFAFALGPGDSLWVLDPPQQRVTVYTPGTATTARSFRVRTHIDRILPLKGGQFVGVTQRLDEVPDRVRVHLFAADGKMLNAIGTPGAPLARPVVALSRNGNSVWIARSDNYTIESWGLDGKQLSSVHRTVDWFTPEAVLKARREKRTPPSITALSEDDGGGLWVTLQKPDPAFKPVGTKTKAATPPKSDVLPVLEILIVPAARIEFAEETTLPLYRLSNDYVVEPNVKGAVQTWRVAKVSFVKR